jgi:hypothetical protein
MAGRDRMTIEEVVRQVLRDEHADVIRESVRAVAQEIMEVEVSELIGAEHGERRPEDRATGLLPARVDSSGRVGLWVSEGIVPGLGDLGRGSVVQTRVGPVV